MGASERISTYLGLVYLSSMSKKQSNNRKSNAAFQQAVISDLTILARNVQGLFEVSVALTRLLIQKGVITDAELTAAATPAPPAAPITDPSRLLAENVA